jgi:hypothetical protein
MSAAARELGISPQRLWQLVQDGKLGRQVAGHYWLFTQEEVEAFKPRIQGKAGRPKGSRNVPKPA